MQILYIIPGYGQTKRSYRWLIAAASGKYKAIFLDLQLKGNSLRALAKTPLQKDSVVVGFSIGALIAHKLTTPVQKGIYCSMSDILGADARGKLQALREHFGRKTTDELMKMRYGKSRAKKLVYFYADKEASPHLQKFGKIRYVRDSGHALTANYREAILRELHLHAPTP